VTGPAATAVNPAQKAADAEESLRVGRFLRLSPVPPPFASPHRPPSGVSFAAGVVLGTIRCGFCVFILQSTHIIV